MTKGIAMKGLLLSFLTSLCCLLPYGAAANPSMLPLIDKQPGYQPLIRDAAPLHGILVVRKDSPLQRVEDLRDKALAVPALSALGASLLPHTEAVAIIRAGRGTHFDPGLVDVFEGLHERFALIAKQYADGV